MNLRYIKRLYHNSDFYTIIYIIEFKFNTIHYSYLHSCMTPKILQSGNHSPTFFTINFNFPFIRIANPI